MGEFDNWTAQVPGTNELRLEFAKRYGPSHSYISRTGAEIVSRA
jgi:hypothetical protein